MIWNSVHNWPENHVEVLVTCLRPEIYDEENGVKTIKNEEKYVTTARCVGGYWFTQDGSEFEDEILFWTPLPNPYDSDEKEQKLPYPQAKNPYEMVMNAWISDFGWSTDLKTADRVYKNLSEAQKIETAPAFLKALFYEFKE